MYETGTTLYSGLIQQAHLHVRAVSRKVQHATTKCSRLIATLYMAQKSLPCYYLGKQGSQ